MIFNRHSDLEGLHATLSASKSHWVNYTDEKFDATFNARLQAARGTELHEFAAQAIKLGQRLKASRKTLNLYVNDAIGYRMTPEQVLAYSVNAFGTADAISFRKNMLRIHDLKTGTTPCSFRQLEVYSALFCLEYRVRPAEIDEIELRIYQNDEVFIHHPEVEDIIHIMGRIEHFDRRIEKLKAEALL